MAFFSFRGTGLIFAIRSVREQITPGHKRKIYGLFILMFFSAVLEVFGLASIIPVISASSDPSFIHSNGALSYLYELSGVPDDRTFLMLLITALLLIFILKGIYGIFVNYLQSRLVSEIAVELSKQQFSKFFSMPYYEFQQLKSAQIQRDIVSNSSSYVQWIVMSLINLVSELLIVVLIIGGIALYNLQLFVFILLTVGPATYVVSRLIRKYSQMTGEEINKNYPLAYGAVGQAISGYIDIKLSQNENYYLNEFLTHQHRFQWNVVKQLFMNNVPFRTNEVIAFLGIVIIFIYALIIHDGNQHILTLIGLFAAASYRMMPSINRITNCLNFINVNQVTINNLNNYLNFYKEYLKIQKKQKPIRFEKEIEIKNIVYKFPDAQLPVLNNISFKVQRGEKIGFVGSSGSGKTTLMNILLRFYTEQQGQMLVDGIPLTEEFVLSWHRKIGYVKQDIFLLDSTFSKNIALGEKVPDEKRLKEAVRQASLNEFVKTLPHGLDTLIGERGSRLSGGQKQRIGIARALYRNAEIFIFDEATSALDIQTETEVTDCIDALSAADRTIFIIAHRITTLRSCNRIYELKDGAVAGTHTYDELIAKIL